MEDPEEKRTAHSCWKTGVHGTLRNWFPSFKWEKKKNQVGWDGFWWIQGWRWKQSVLPQQGSLPDKQPPELVVPEDQVDHWALPKWDESALASLQAPEQMSQSDTNVQQPLARTRRPSVKVQ